MTDKKFIEHKWEYIENDCISECLDCGHKSKYYAESDSFIFDEDTGEREVFCPKCKSLDYYIIEEGGGL